MYLNAQVPKDKPTAAKNMIRTDPKQQKLDLFINVSKTNDSNHPEKSMDKMPSKWYILFYLGQNLLDDNSWDCQMIRAFVIL